MTAHTLPAMAMILAATPLLRSQSLEKAEVTIPYSELKALLAKSEAPKAPPAPAPVLLSARLRLTMENHSPVIDATFRVSGFDREIGRVPLVAGSISLGSQEPEDAVVVVDDDALNLIVDQPGTRTLQARLLPVLEDGSFQLRLPACPSSILETGAIAPDQSVFLECGGASKLLIGEQSMPLPHAGSTLIFRFLNEEETREARRPPEPSTWTWQNQVLVVPSEDCLIYQIITQATADGGSGLTADLPLPPDARDVVVTGDDLASYRKIGGDKRSQHLNIAWTTRNILDRRVEICYRMPLRPLDRVWKLQAPGGEDTNTRFILPVNPLLSLDAEGLSEPLAPSGLPKSLATAVGTTSCRYLEVSNTAEIRVSQIPVAATAEGVATEAKWALGIEPDGAMLAVGEITLEHKGTLGFLFDTPEGMKLLDCELDGKPVSPVDLGSGGLKVTLPPGKEISKLRCSFTGKTEALDPVEGTLKLALPKVPLFIHMLEWQIALPAGYQAETQGNVTRVSSIQNTAPWQLSLRKKLCRDERPEVHVFYQRTNLNL